MYLSEVRELAFVIQYRMARIEAAQAIWLSNEAIASAEAASPPDAFSHEAFGAALTATREQQGEVFDQFESLMAAWARLSLLLHPIPGTDEVSKWRVKRGEALRSVLQLAPNTLLASRSFRDSWMHFDERLDRAYIEGWLGNRQHFVKSAGVPSARKISVRIIDLEALAFHYRNREGQPEQVGMADMKQCIALVEAGLVGVGSRVAGQFPPPA